MADQPLRILFKLSGEALKAADGPFSPDALQRLSEQIATAPAEWAIVVGGGNLIRGARSPWLDRIEGDTLGMLATVMNALALCSHLEKLGKRVIVQSAVDTQLTSPIAPKEAKAALREGAVVLFAGGTGSPLVTTDTAAAIRAVSIGADLLIKGSNVDGVFTGDPSSGESVSLLPKVSYDEFLANRYGVMDQVAIEICREHKLPVEVFNLAKPDALQAITSRQQIGTRIE